MGYLGTGQPSHWTPGRRTDGAALLSVALFVFLASVGGVQAFASQGQSQHVVVLGDPHLPGKHLQAKAAVLGTLNGWNDINRVVVVGDICEDRGTADEYAFAKQFFAALSKPTHFLAGNHDYIYEDTANARGGRIRGSPENRAGRLRRFKETFGLDEVYSSVRAGDHLLIFLSTDHLLSPHLAQISDRQLDWLRTEVRTHSGTPTIIFFHAPLKGTLLDYNEHANKEDFVAQPREELRELLVKNPQVFLWVAGHMHVPATNESFRSPVNLFEGRVMAIHAPDMNRERIWTTSLFLYSDRVVVKTFDHKKGAWMDGLERTVKTVRN